MAMKLHSPIAKATENLLTCPVCLEFYTEPRSLVCLHTFCSSCLEQMQNRLLRIIVCPMCKTKTGLPSLGVPGLPNDFKIEQMKDILQSSDEVDPVERRNCDVCKGTKENVADFHCSRCSVFYCQDCVKKHNGNPMFNDHVIIEISPRQTDGDFQCKTHTHCVLSFRCQTCTSNCLLCPICILDHDESHDISNLDKVAETARNTLKENLEKVEGRINVTHDYLVYVRERETQYDEMLLKAQESISKQTTQLIEALRNEETKLLKEAQLRFQEKVTRYNKNGVSSVLTSLETLQIQLQYGMEGSDEDCIKSQQEFSQSAKKLLRTNPIPQGIPEDELYFVPNSAEIQIQLGVFSSCETGSRQANAEAMQLTGIPALRSIERQVLSNTRGDRLRCDQCKEPKPLVTLYCLRTKRNKNLCQECKRAANSVLIHPSVQSRVSDI